MKGYQQLINWFLTILFNIDLKKYLDIILVLIFSNNSKEVDFRRDLIRVQC